MNTRSKKKIFNDPVYGFISIPDALHFEIIEHPYFQRLRRIMQLGLTHFVYPGALHTRYNHSLGAMHLMQQAIGVLRSKGHTISSEEAQAVSLAILLHDAGHGPFSHTLEQTIVKNLAHEQLSLHIMKALNDTFNGALDMTISIFKGSYSRKFLNKLVASQLDMDRIDYLKRDSFYTGVTEGSINADRLIAMLDIVDDELVIEAKGIYSVENFLVARRQMYWQVYLHKTVLSAEFMLMNVLKRAKELSLQGHDLIATPALTYFLRENPTLLSFEKDKLPLKMFMQLDDYDVFTALKRWQMHNDKVLSLLSYGIVNRRLFKVELSNSPFSEERTKKIKGNIMRTFDLNSEEAQLLFIEEKTSNHTYLPDKSQINILYRDGSVLDIAIASDQLNETVLSLPATKYFICYPKGMTEIK